MKRRLEMLLLKLADGGRRLRFDEASSDLGLENRLQPEGPVAGQKARWERAFAEMLDRELGVAVRQGGESQEQVRNMLGTS